MNWLIADALAQAPGAGSQGSPYQIWIMMAALFAVFYFLLIRPQAKRAKEHKALIAGLSKGDEIIIAGGVLGRITQLNENYVTVEIADKVEIKVQRSAVQAVLPKGTLKSVDQ